MTDAGGYNNNHRTDKLNITGLWRLNANDMSLQEVCVSVRVDGWMGGWVGGWLGVWVWVWVWVWVCISIM